MTERRIVDDPDTPSFDRELLRAWDAQRPAPEALERAMALAPIAGAATAAGAAANAGAAGGSVAPKAAAGAGALAKWLLGAGAIVAVAGGGAAIARRASTPPATTTTATAAATPTVRASATPSAAAEPSATPVAALPEARPAHAPASGAARAPKGTLDDEIAAMDRVREAVASKDAARTIALVDDYERRYPAGAFVEEAEVRRIEALAVAGDDARARSTAERFLRAHPASPHAARVRALVTPASP